MSNPPEQGLPITVRSSSSPHRPLPTATCTWAIWVGPYLGADAYVRFQRMNGAQVFHIAGSDDFQSYVVGAARRDGRSCAETAAHYSAEILATHQLMDIEHRRVHGVRGRARLSRAGATILRRWPPPTLVTVRRTRRCSTARPANTSMKSMHPAVARPAAARPAATCARSAASRTSAPTWSSAGRRLVRPPPVVGELSRYSLALSELQADVRLTTGSAGCRPGSRN